MLFPESLQRYSTFSFRVSFQRFFPDFFSFTEHFWNCLQIYSRNFLGIPSNYFFQKMLRFKIFYEKFTSKTFGFLIEISSKYLPKVSSKTLLEFLFSGLHLKINPPIHYSNFPIVLKIHHEVPPGIYECWVKILQENNFRILSKIPTEILPEILTIFPSGIYQEDLSMISTRNLSNIHPYFFFHWHLTAFSRASLHKNFPDSFIGLLPEFFQDFLPEFLQKIFLSFVLESFKAFLQSIFRNISSGFCQNSSKISREILLEIPFGFFFKHSFLNSSKETILYSFMNLYQNSQN